MEPVRVFPDPRLLAHLESALMNRRLATASTALLAGWALLACAAPGSSTTTSGPSGPSTAATPMPAAPPPLAGTRWRLVALQSMDDAQGTTRVADPSRYTLQFLPEGRLALRLDCNRGGGSWLGEAGASEGPRGTLRGSLRFGAVALTRMACPADSLDMRVGRQLAYVRGFVLEGDRLTLSLMADGGLLHWVRD